MTISMLTTADFANRPAEEARARFDRKIVVPDDVFEDLSADARAQAVRLVGIHKARVVERCAKVISKAIEDGTSYAEARRLIMAIIGEAGETPPSLNLLRTVFQQQTHQAYSDARRELFDDPAVLEKFPFRQYLTVGNGTPLFRNVRPEHAALHGLVFHAKDPFWDAHTPPWDYG